MTREEALTLMKEHTPSESLQRHMLAVEACMRWHAAQTGEDVEAWGLAGLLHDFDYELHPEEHPLWGMALLESRGVDPAIVNAIAAHYPAKTGVEPESAMERTLFAVDELSGFLTAVAYVRPSRKIAEVEVKSVLKKLKTASFAAGVNRDDVARGAELMGLSLEDHIQRVLTAMKEEAESLGL
jgi:putative nucleotidyltransferase with HDIG domain